MQKRIFFLVFLISFLSVSIFGQTKNVIIDQVKSDNSQVGELNLWDGNDFDEIIQPGTDIDFPLYQNQTILGSQLLIDGEKYCNWNLQMSDVVNFKTFEITPLTNMLVSYFDETHTGIIIRNSLEGLIPAAGIIVFRDPWIADLKDSGYNNQKRNRGMSAHPHS